ncbi:16S rRNA (guanine(966)-N(2))-methyltransferase RsmD [bacterium]|nr:16S rRNA (guanine(966)-N(2))-methyltransferase RsmD [bacterium]
MNITAGKYKGRKILAPDEKITRPTLSKVRMAVFNTLQALIDFENASFLDMFAGSGIMGLEALSRGFKKVLAIEQNPKVLKILNENYKLLNIRPNILRGDSLKIVPNEFFDVIYIDPPYYAGIYEKILSILPKSNIVIIEHTVDIDFKGFEIIKQKKYGDKKVTYLKKRD